MRSSLFNRNRDSGMNDVRLDSLVVYCADIGSVQRGKFGWASRRRIGPDPPKSGGTDIQELVTQVACDLNGGKKVALGFECPLWVPVSCDPRELTSARCGEGNHPWSAGAGATSLATGLTETAWILSRIRSETQDVEAFLDWPRFRCRRIRPVPLGSDGYGSETALAPPTRKTRPTRRTRRRPHAPSSRRMPDPTASNAVTSPHKVRSLIGAALLWAGWSNDLKLLKKRCIVIKP